MENKLFFLRMKQKFNVFLLFTVTLLLVFSAFPVKQTQAATFNDYGHRYGRIDIEPFNYNSTWQNPMNASLSSWNYSSANVDIRKSIYSGNRYIASSYSDTWYGLCTQWLYVGTRYTARFEIKLNSREIVADATNFYNFVDSVGTHEFGHIFWLADNPNTGNGSIMNYNRNRNTLTNPTSFDINNVNSKY